MGVEAGLHAALDVFVEGVGREGDDGDGTCVRAFHLPDGPGGFEAVHDRHAHVHQDGVVISGIVVAEHLHRDLAVPGMVDLHLAHGQDHDHDLGVDLHVLRQEDPAALEVGFRGSRGSLLFAEGLAEFIHDRLREEGLGDKGVHAGAQGFVRHVVPVVGGQDDDGGFVAHDFADPPGGLDAVHLRHLPVDQDQVVGLLAGVAEPDHLHSLRA